MSRHIGRVHRGVVNIDRRAYVGRIIANGLNQGDVRGDADAIADDECELLDERAIPTRIALGEVNAVLHGIGEILAVGRNLLESRAHLVPQHIGADVGPVAKGGVVRWCLEIVLECHSLVSKAPRA
jgi:hypothetical protein